MSRLIHAAAVCLAVLTSAQFAEAAAVLKIGSSYSVTEIEVIQVVSGTEALVKIDGEWVWIDGLDTDGFVDGKSYIYRKNVLVLDITGTKSYQSLAGRRTVLLAKPETKEARKARERANREEREAEDRLDRASEFARDLIETEKREAAKRKAENIRAAQQKTQFTRKLKLARMVLRDAEAASTAGNDAERDRLLELARGYLKSIIRGAPKSAEAAAARELLK